MFSWRNGTILVLATFFLTVHAPASAQQKVKAFGTIQFGDPARTVLKKTVTEELLPLPLIALGNNALSPQGPLDVSVGGQEFNVTFYFTGDRLYRVQFDGKEQDAGGFESTVAEQRDVLAEALETRHGQPSVTRRVDRDDVEPGGFKTTHHWTAEDLGVSKEIWVGIVQAGEKYYASLIVHQPELASGAKQEEGTTGDLTTARVELSTDELASAF